MFEVSCLKLAQQNAFGDSSKAGQMFNGAAYADLSSPVYSTLTYGRQNSLSSDLIISYDPLSGSNAWSVITFQGASGGGTENRVYDNSFEYRRAAADRWMRFPLSPIGALRNTSMPTRL